MPPEHEVTGSNPVGRVMESGGGNGRKRGREIAGVPLGAILTVIGGLLLTVVCALLTNVDLATGERIEYESDGRIPDSEPAKLGRDGEIQIVDAGLAATRGNNSEYRIYRVTGALTIDPGSSTRRIDADCAVRVPDGVILGRTPGRRASFPQPSEDLKIQEVPEVVILRFNAKGSDINGVELIDAFETYTNASDVLVEWSPYRQGSHRWEYVAKGAKRDIPIRLNFASMWRTIDVPPAADIGCRVAYPDGKPARVSTSGEIG
jgi:hypothetical protein